MPGRRQISSAGRGGQRQRSLPAAALLEAKQQAGEEPVARADRRVDVDRWREHAELADLRHRDGALAAARDHDVAHAAAAQHACAREDGFLGVHRQVQEAAKLVVVHLENGRQAVGLEEVLGYRPVDVERRPAALRGHGGDQIAVQRGRHTGRQRPRDHEPGVGAHAPQDVAAQLLDGLGRHGRAGGGEQRVLVGRPIEDVRIRARLAGVRDEVAPDALVV